MLEPVPFVALVIEHVLGLARFAKFTKEPGAIQTFYEGPEGTGI